MSEIILPEILHIPDKLIPMITRFNEFEYFLLEGGRGSSKSCSIARFILYICSIQTVRCFCVREVQNSIEDSVYQLLVDLISQFKLDFEVQKAVLRHRVTGSTIKFKGLREQGKDNIKSLEGANIVWVEEAQSISKPALDTLIPTIRKEKSKIFFSMNRFIRTDAVYEAMANNPRCLCIHIDYFDNPWCPRSLIIQAETCKKENPRDYSHIWLGEPMDTTTDFLFDFSAIARLPDNELVGDDCMYAQTALSVDFAGGGGDLCVASILERVTNTQWRLADQVVWTNPDTDHSVGKTIALYGEHKPDVFVVDAGGLGYPMFVSISKTVPSVIGFDGAKTDKKANNAANNRAGGYLTFADWVSRGYLICKSKATIKELETIRKVYRNNGTILIESKIDMKKNGGHSPDRSDSVMMGIWAIEHYLGKQTVGATPEGMRIQRVNVRRGY